MAEGRMLRKDIANSEKLGLCSDKARVLYFMLLPHLDVRGRLYANPKIIKGQYTTMLNYSVSTIQRCLEELHKVRGKEVNGAGLVVLYTVAGKQYLQYTRFEDFQSLKPEREAKSKIPDPTPANSCELLRTPLKLSKDKLSKDNYSVIFLDFWKRYPSRWIQESDRRVKVGKYLAWEQWQKLNEEQQISALLATKSMVSGKAVPDAWRWLRDKKFDDAEIKPELLNGWRKLIIDKYFTCNI